MKGKRKKKGTWWRACDACEAHDQSKPLTNNNLNLTTCEHCLLAQPQSTKHPPKKKKKFFFYFFIFKKRWFMFGKTWHSSCGPNFLAQIQPMGIRGPGWDPSAKWICLHMLANMLDQGQCTGSSRTLAYQMRRVTWGQSIHWPQLRSFN